MAQDTEIPVPLTSGTTDHPDAIQSGAVAPPPLPAGYQRANQAAAPVTPPPLPTGYKRSVQAPAAPYAGKTGLEETTPPESNVDKALDTGISMYNGEKRGVNYAMGDKPSTPQKSSAKSTLTVPGAPAPVTFQDKNAQGMQKMSYLDPSSAGQSTNAGKLQGLPGVDPRTPRFREGLSDTMLAAAPAMIPAAIAAPAATAGALVGGDIGAKVGGKVGGTLAEAVHEGAGPTGEDVGSTVGMLAGAHRGGVIGEQVGREATPQMPEVKTPLKDLTDVQREASDNVDSLAKDKEAAQKKLEAALKEHNKHIASHEQGIGSPEKVVNEVKKAQAAYDEAEAHHALAKERLDKVTAPPPPLPTGYTRVGEAQTPEVPTEDIKAAPAAKAEEVPAEKRAGERRQAEVPVEDERRTGERRNDAGLRVDAEGNPTLSPDVEGHWQAGAFGEKPVEDIGSKAREVNPEPTRAETKPVLPKEEPTGYAAKKEEVVPAGTEGREPVKSAAEYHPAVQQKVGELSDANLKQLAKAHGLNPDEYDFNARDERRHRIERDQLAKDITAEMGEDEKINLGRAADATEKQGLFQGADTSAKGRAARAEKMFPRLRGPVDEAGNPKVSGGSQAADVEAEKLKEHVAKTSAKDTDHMQSAIKELGPDAKLSDITKRAQELKDTHAQLAEHEKNGGSTFSSKGKDLNGTDKYSVGAYPDRTEQVDKLTPERLEEFKKKNADVLSKEDHAVGTWKNPDTGKAVLDATKLYTDRDEAIAAGKAANQKSIYHLGGEGEIQTGGTGEVNAKGSPVDEFGNPTVSGGAPEKKLPTGDQLIKKYGESSGDPKDTTFILKDGRGVKNTGNIHDEMLGGKATDKNPPRERFVAEGNIRVRPHQGAGGREVAFSIPESGVSSEQLKYIQKMSPQLRSGAVMLEVGKPGGSYKTIPHGEASPEALETAIRGIGPVLNDKGSPIDWNGNPTVSGGSPAAGVGTAKAKATPEDLQKTLPDLAQQHLTDEEKASITTSATGKPRTAGTEKFISNMEKIPTVQEYTDIALQGEGSKDWYSRSTRAFDAMHEEAPDYFKEGDKEKFMGVLAGSSPQQSVANNLKETLGFWKEWHDAGRPEFSLDKWKKFGDEADAEWKEDGSPRARGMAKGASMHWDYAPKGDEWKAENLLLKNLTLPETKVPNILKALNGEPMWPDLQKNAAFKAPSFAENLRKWIGGKSTGTKNVTNDSWMGLFGGIDKSALSKPENYHPLSVATRAAAAELGWEPEQAQAAIWSFTQALTEKGVEEPELVRHYSEDFKDLLENDVEVREQLEGLGVNLDQLDSKLTAIGEKPKVSGRSTATTAHSVGQLKSRIEDARGKGAIPEPKSVQGSLFRENPAFEHKANPGAGHTIRDEGTRFNPEDFKDEESGLAKLGEKKKKSPYGKL